MTSQTLPPRSSLEERRADTPEGEATLARARALARRPEYAHLTDSELIRLAYWGASGEPGAGRHG